jgi:DNA-binding response OmpR family regulator
MRVLIIDDHKGFRDELRQILTRHGHDADDMESASEAIGPAETGNYDIILLDYQMPEHDGLWFLRKARIPRQTKVLLVTNHSHPRMIAEMFRAGASGYLIKPFDEEDLLRNVAFYTDGRAVHLAPKDLRTEK